MARKTEQVSPKFRLAALAGVLGLAALVLLWRAVDLHVFNKDFLQEQGDARALRVVGIPAHRGMITDRRGEPLAISTPVDSVWAHPGELLKARRDWPKLARLLDLDPGDLEQLLVSRRDRAFVYLKRHVAPALGKRVMDLDLPGVALQREYRRYYPMGEVAAHVVGFTNIDDIGQEGLELAYNDWLRGTPGGKRVIKDRLGRIVEDVESISEPSPGHDLTLSIDRRMQYLAYRELKRAVQRHHARSGTAVVLDARTGEVLAMVNQPSYNPNNRSDLDSAALRNRAATDVFEPGSTIKPFTIAAALESGKYTPTTPVDASPGWYRVGGGTVRDVHNYGKIDVTTVITKSSNVGASRIALSLPSRTLWSMFDRVGFGQRTGSGFPGESSGLLTSYTDWHPLDHATMAFGYGLSVTALQLAHAYTALAADGVLRPISFLRQDPHAAGKGTRVMSAQTARAVRKMMETVVAPGGTAPTAQVAGYRVAGKTGTVKKVGPHGYSDHRYQAVFVGIVPASEPRLVMVVKLDEPQGREYYGGLVAAPVFQRVMSEALRLLDIAPDDLQGQTQRIAYVGEGQQ